jgi:hypothetical protein
LPPAPHGLPRWHDMPYMVTWAVQVTSFIGFRADKVEPVPIRADERINDLENIQLFVATGKPK